MLCRVCRLTDGPVILVEKLPKAVVRHTMWQAGAQAECEQADQVLGVKVLHQHMNMHRASEPSCSILAPISIHGIRKRNMLHQLSQNWDQPETP